jgi:hypothetical protein
MKERKSVRFAVLVKACGRPEPVTLWADPRKDKRFMTAVRQNRIMTVEQENVGVKKDVGIIGFIKERNASYFIFPKPLNAFTGKEVKGIKYDLVNQPAAMEPAGALKRSVWVGEMQKMEPEKRYCVTIRWMATMNTAIEVQAKDRKTAGKIALGSECIPDLSKAKTSSKVLRIEEL